MIYGPKRKRLREGFPLAMRSLAKLHWIEDPVLTGLLFFLDPRQVATISLACSSSSPMLVSSVSILPRSAQIRLVCSSSPSRSISFLLMKSRLRQMFAVKEGWVFADPALGFYFSSFFSSRFSRPLSNLMRVHLSPSCISKSAERRPE